MILPKMDSISVGKSGENIAQEYLEKKGYNVIDRNYRTKYGEIDLIVKKDGILIFVEVRSKTGEQFGTPEDTINRIKVRKIQRNAIAYAARKKWQGQYKIDAICIILNQDNSVKRLDHYENI